MFLWGVDLKGTADDVRRQVDEVMSSRDVSNFSTSFSTIHFLVSADSVK
jgi:hypothetical protein